MQIITIDDLDFPELLAAWKEAPQIGKYYRGGKAHILCATNNFLLISNNDAPTKIGLKPTRSFLQAKELGLEILKREERQGTEVVLK